MPTAGFLAATGLTLLVCVVYGRIGVWYWKRADPQGMRLPYAIFWLGIALYGATDAAWGLAVATVDPPLAWGAVALQVKIISGVAAFFGLVYYLVYLYTGSRRTLWPLLAFYAFVLAFVVYSYAARDPVGQEARAWGSGLVYANEGGLVTDVAYALLFGPPLLASLAYAALIRRAGAPKQRVRIAATSVAFAAFFGGVLLAWVTAAVPAWPLIEKALALTTGLVVLGTLWGTEA